MKAQIAQMAGHTAEPLPGQTIVELFGDQRVLVELHQGVTEYSDCQVRVKVKYGHLCVCGNGLCLARMSADQLVITGRIDSVSVLRGR